jgi:ankyrin repeat protein
MTCEEGKWRVVSGHEETSLLLRAVNETHDVEVVRLIKHGANVDAGESHQAWGPDMVKDWHVMGDTPLTRACSAGNHEMTSVLLKVGADPDKADGSRRLPLLCALDAKDTTSMKALMDAGCTLSPNGKHILMQGSKYEQLDESIQHFLLNHGAGKSLPSSALFFACETGHEAIAQWLLENGADIIANYGDKGSTQSQRSYHPIHAAVTRGNTNIVDLLLRHGATLADDASMVLTPLMCASQSDDATMVRFLLSKGANPEQRSKNGMTAMQLAAMWSSPAVIAALHTVSPELIHSREGTGQAPLWLAAGASRNSLESVRLLLTYGADPRVTHEGETLLDTLQKGLQGAEKCNDEKRIKRLKAFVDLLASWEPADTVVSVSGK